MKFKIYLFKGNSFSAKKVQQRQALDGVENICIVREESLWAKVKHNLQWTQQIDDRN